jgi:DnaA family protein
MTAQLVLELAPVAPPTFDNFVVGRNHAALAALRAAARGAERVVYLWGERGSGRTHLLEAAQREARALGRGELLAVRDDVDALDAAAQIEAFDAFNAARLRSAAFVAAGSAPPPQLDVREDLRTRLASGLVFELHALDDDAKAATLAAHAHGRGLTLAPEVVRYLLHRLPRDLGTQLAALDALDRYALAQKRAVTLPLVREALDALGLR